GDAGLHYGLAGVRRAIGDLAGAIAEYGRAVELAPAMVSAHNDRAIALDEAGEPEAALRGFQQAAELAPDDPFVHANLAAMLQRMGRAEQAAAAYRRALELNPDFGKDPDSHPAP
ncbi:tetratricopeptide repeat protein, partial [candidate division WOR-3 bacterium]|nr:tetratricopeptide repeat protein [candidate division WOR-3 bacterium]